jgi:hypothetical protein
MGFRLAFALTAVLSVLFPAPSSAADGGARSAPGERCAANTQCAKVCFAGDRRCGKPGGVPCASNDECRGGVCAADGRCGRSNGDPCSAPEGCRSGICIAGTCGARCRADDSCAAADHCGTDQRCTPALEIDSQCDRPRVCGTGTCAADGRCGERDGEPCNTAASCRADACDGIVRVCKAMCSTDGTCKGDSYCEDLTRICIPRHAPGLTCRRDTMCASGICATDGRCGKADGSPCADPSECRSGLCNGGACARAGCSNDDACAVGAFCDGAGLCQPTKVTKARCGRDAECTGGICHGGLCGAPEGVACGSDSLCRSGTCAGGSVCAACTDGSCPPDAPAPDAGVAPLVDASIADDGSARQPPALEGGTPDAGGDGAAITGPTPGEPAGGPTPDEPDCSCTLVGGEGSRRVGFGPLVLPIAGAFLHRCRRRRARGGVGGA